MKVGDIVFGRIDNDKVWPGKVHKLQVVPEVKYYKIKLPKKTPPEHIIPFSIELSQKFQSANEEKSFVVAIKMAEKDYNSLMGVLKQKNSEVKEHDVKKMISISISNSFPLEIKEEEDYCKEQEQEEKSKEAAATSYESFLDFLVVQNELVIIQDCRQNRVRQFTYMCSATKKMVALQKPPKYVLISMLEELLHLSCVEKGKFQKFMYQKKVINIVNSNIVGLEDCIKSKVMKLMNFSLNFMREIEELTKDETDYLLSIKNFCDSVNQKFNHNLDDDNDIVELAEYLQMLSLAGNIK